MIGGFMVCVLGGVYVDVFDGFFGSGNVVYDIDGGVFFYLGDLFELLLYLVDVFGIVVCVFWFKLVDIIGYL